jgi:Fur family peroxide stress response transcriptional regulator
MPEPQIRLTPQRHAVLDVIRKAMDHPTANEIFQRVQALHPGMAYGTVYTALKALVSHDLIQELKFGDDASRYDGRVEHHHHVLCRVCGKLGEVEIDLSDDQWAEVIAQTDFEIHTHHIQFVGYCLRCRTPKPQGERR